MWKMYILILKFWFTCQNKHVQRQICVIQCQKSHVEIWIHMWRKSVVFSSTFLCKILRFRRNLDFYISIYWNVKFASSHVNYTFTHAKILTYKKIMLNWTFSQLTFFLTHVSKHETWHIESHKSASSHVYFDIWTTIFRFEIDIFH